MFNTVTNLRLSNKYPLIIYQHPSIKYHIMCRHKYCDCIGCEATNSAPIFFHFEENKATKRLQYCTASHCNVLERLILNVTSVCKQGQTSFCNFYYTLNFIGLYFIFAITPNLASGLYKGH